MGNENPPPPSGRRLAAILGIWLLLQLAIVLVAPTIGGDGRTPVYQVLASLSLFASLLFPFFVWRAKIRLWSGIAVAAILGIAWFLDPRALFSFPVLPGEAYFYYILLAGLGLAVGGTALQLSLAVVRHPSIPSPEVKVEGTEELAAGLRRRAAAYRGESRWFLFVIIAAIVAGTLIFTFADVLAAQDVQRRLSEVRNNLRAVQDLHENVQKTVATVEERAAEDREGLIKPIEQQSEAIQRSLDQPWSWFLTPDAVAAIREANDSVQVALRSARDDDLLTEVDEELEQVNRNLGAFVSWLGTSGGRSAQQLDSVLASMAQADQEEKALRTILSSLSTRIGSVLLIVFLVQILAGLYRYSARMAAHYESRGDMLSFGDDVVKADPVRFLSTSQVDFGKSPKAPTGQIREIVGSTVEALRRRE